MEYSMKQLQEITGKPPQTINRLMRTNEGLIALLPAHREKKSNNKVFYDDAILEWLKEYFDLEKLPLTENGVAPSKNIVENEEIPNTTPRPSENEALIDELKRQVDELEEQLAAKNKEILNLEKELSDKEAERLHFITLTSQLTALLAAEKQEKQKLLPAPRQTLGERIKSLFGKTKVKGDSVNE